MKKLSKYYSKKAAFLKCPHCMAETHVGHFAWSALICLNCKAIVNKEDWFLSDWQDAEQNVQPTIATAALEDSPFETGIRRNAVVLSNRNSG